MKLTYQITAVVFFLCSAFIVRESLQLRYYTPSGPGPGFFPFWLAFLLGGLSLGTFYQATWGKWKLEPIPADFWASRKGYLRMGAIIVATVGVILLLDPLGFRLTMLAYLLFLLFALGRVNLITVTLVSLAGSFGAYHLFVELLKVPLPIGVFGI